MRTSKRALPLLLDTHVWLGVLEGDERLASPDVRRSVDLAAAAGQVRVSAISVWEVAMLEAKGRIRLAKDCLEWVTEALAVPGFALAPLTPEVAVGASRLPGDFHGDPADRILVATARALGAVLVTKDRRILDYGRDDFLAVMPA